MGYDFPGRDALRADQKQPLPRRARRLGIAGRAARPRRLSDPAGRPAGGPGHQRHILAHAGAGRSPWATCGRELAAPGTELTVDIRGRKEPGPRRRTSLLSPQSNKEHHASDARKTAVTPRPTNGCPWKPTPAARRSPPWAYPPSPSKALTDLVYIELPPVGRQVAAGEPFGEVESVKAVSDIYSPVDGEVVAVNTAMAENLDTWPTTPTGPAGW